MPDKETGRQARASQKATTPEDYATTPSRTLSGLDHSFIIQLISEVQKSVGGLTEAVTSLKEQSREHGKKLEEISREVYSIGKDVHGAKVTAKVAGVILGLVGAMIAGAGTFLGVAIKAAIEYFHNSPSPR